jgi:hypothetical protein
MRFVLVDDADEVRELVAEALSSSDDPGIR